MLGLFMKKRNFGARQVLVTYLQGLAVGTAEIIPGVSGSTVALLLGIYDDFIDLLYQASELVKVGLLWVIRRKSWKDVTKQIQSIRWSFGIVLGLGMMTAIAALSTVITVILTTYPQYLMAFLLGLLPPTSLIVYRQIKKVSRKEVLITGLTTAVLLGIFVLGGSASSITNPHPLHVFVGGVVAISAMVLPGVSGSFMLLVLGLYSWAVGTLVRVTSGGATPQDLMLLLTLLAGVGTGFLTSVRVLKFMFNKYRNELMSFLLGLLLASWYVLWPFVKIIGIDHDSPILEKVLPWQLPLVEMISLTAITIATMSAVYYLHEWADRHDPHSPKPDSGFDQI